MFLVTSREAHAVRFTGQTGLSATSYASEETMERRFDLDLQLKSDSKLKGTPLLKWEVELKTFFEGKVEGDKSLDTGDFGYRWGVGEDSHIWLGRFQPARESHARGRRYLPVTPKDAIGAHWVQQKADALSPRNQGWLSLGLHKKISSSMSYTLAGSYFFIPSLGPTAKLSSDESPSGTRFSSLPPYYADIDNNGTLVPLHYQVDVDLAKVIFQPQFFAAFTILSGEAGFEAGFKMNSTQCFPGLKCSLACSMQAANSLVSSFKWSLKVGQNEVKPL